MGRWDITYIKNPKHPGNAITRAYDVASLVAVAENNPEAWLELKDLIKKVDEVV